MKSRIAKGLATLGLVGLFAGCSHEAPELQDAKKELKLQGFVEQPARILLSNGLLRPNQLYLDVQLDCNSEYACNDLDLKYHGKSGTVKSIHTLLETGENIPNFHKGDAVHFTLTEGFTQSGRLAVGDPLYWINTSPARGRLLEYFPPR